MFPFFPMTVHFKITLEEKNILSFNLWDNCSFLLSVFRKQAKEREREKEEKKKRRKKRKRKEKGENNFSFIINSNALIFYQEINV